ncbi:MAG: hypothetical protein Q8O19_02780, partial [Rectinemataceae bacterium]|nr:hypothetical protein [Rectinemataceae bacterium]
TQSAFTSALEHRVIVIESVLLALCLRLGDEPVRRLMDPLRTIDKTLMVCFSPGNPSPREALQSYYNALAAEVHPLLLWKP